MLIICISQKGHKHQRSRKTCQEIRCDGIAAVISTKKKKTKVLYSSELWLENCKP